MSNVVSMHTHQHEWYILDGKTALPVSFDDWLKWMSDNRGNMHIRDDRFGDARVSTIFLGLNHNHGFSREPQLFETMIFGGEHDQWTERCARYDQAVAMHEKACALVRGQ